MNSTVFDTLSRSSLGTDGSFSFHVDPNKLSTKEQELYKRLLPQGDSWLVERKVNASSLQGSKQNVQEIAVKVRQTIASSNTCISVPTSRRTPSIFDCWSFRIACTRSNEFAMRGWTKEVQITYQADDLFFIGYTVAILAFIDKHKDNPEFMDKLQGSKLAIVEKVISLSSTADLEVILQDRDSLEGMMMWLKNFAKFEDKYAFSPKDNSNIEGLLGRVGLQINITKQERSGCFGSTLQRHEIFQASEPSGELVWKGGSKASYFYG